MEGSAPLEFTIMNFTVQIQQFPGRHLAIVRRRATLQQLSQVIPQACGEVWNAIRASGVQGAGRNVAVYLDNEMNLEIGVELDVPLAAIGGVIPSKLPSGTVATTTHLGPYHGLGNAHQAVIEWCKSQGHELVRPCWETYGHWVEEWNQDPSKIRTDVFYLLKTNH
jgi:effector-binding domain-containing protein